MSNANKRMFRTVTRSDYFFIISYMADRSVLKNGRMENIKVKLLQY